MGKGSAVSVLLAAGSILSSALGDASVAGEAQRFRLVGRVDQPADWVVTDGARVVFGSGRQLWVAGQSLASQSELRLDAPITDGALLGTLLFLVEEGERLRLLDLDAPLAGTRPVPLAPAPRGRLSLARAGIHLVVAEDGYGVRLLRKLPQHDHHDHPLDLDRAVEPVGFLSLPKAFAAVAGASRSVYLASERELLEVGVRDRRPTIVRGIALDVELEDLSVNGSSLYLLGSDGLRARALARLEEPAAGVGASDVRGGSTALAGRVIYVAAGRAGLFAYRDETAGAQLHPVTVGDNFFNPVDLAIDVGDTVEWTNASMTEHNVFSCNPDETGCDGESSTETFTSGPATTFWVYSYEFTLPGQNPYVCQPHAAAGMVGNVTASGGPPPVVPDGSGGTAMRVDKLDQSGSTLSVEWDTTSCTDATDHQILYGPGAGLPANLLAPYELEGAECAIGLTSPYVWMNVPDPTGDPKNLLWWVVVATDGLETEGSWGRKSNGFERAGQGPGQSSGECDVTGRDLSNTCGQ